MNIKRCFFVKKYICKKFNRLIKIEKYDKSRFSKLFKCYSSISVTIYKRKYTSLEYKIFVPTIESQPTDDGRLLIDLSSKLKKGKFKYSFALIKHYSIYRSYLILDEIEGNFIKFVLEKSKNKDNFISLVNIINQQLGLNYDAYNYNRVALVIKIYDEHYYDFHLNVDLSVPVPTVSKLTLLKEKYINAWLELPIAEKIQELKRIYEKELGLIKKESFV